MKYFLILILIFSFITTASAEENVKPAVYVLPQGFKGMNTFNATVDHFLGGQEIVLPFVLSNAPQARVKMRVKAVQLTVAMGAPSEPEADIAVSQTPDRISTENKVKVQLPGVERETEFKLQFQVLMKDQWENAGEKTIRVYPNTICEPLKAWSKRVQLRLYNRDGELAQFLEKNGIEFVDVQAAKLFNHQAPSVTIWVIDEGSEAVLPEAQNNDKVILIKTGGRSLSKIIMKKTGEIGVDMDIVSNIANDPLKQKAFVEIINLINE